MNTNGRSASPAGHLITTSDETRRTRWLHIFGSECLPVLCDTPRWQEQQGAGMNPAKAFPVLAYDLALGELSEAQRARFAGHLSRKYRMEYAAVLLDLETAVSYPIKASFDIQVVEPAEEQLPLASLLSGGGWWRLWKRPFPRLAFG